MLCLDQAGLIQFIKHTGWPEFCMGSRLSLMVSGSDQSDELDVFHSDNGNVSPRNKLSLTAVLENLTVQLKYFNCLVQCSTLQKYNSDHFQINYVYKFKYFFSNYSLFWVPLKQLEKCYTSHPAGATPTRGPIQRKFDGVSAQLKH